jgi:hypothetical protein
MKLPGLGQYQVGDRRINRMKCLLGQDRLRKPERDWRGKSVGAGLDIRTATPPLNVPIERSIGQGLILLTVPTR